MKVTIDHTELLAILHNSQTINDATIKVVERAAAKDLRGTLDAVARSHELILQSLKSTNAIINQVRERNFPDGILR